MRFTETKGCKGAQDIPDRCNRCELITILGSGRKEPITDLLLPLGTTICRVASTQYFVIGSIFAAQIYGIDMSLATYATIIIFSIAAGIASSGSSGAVTVVLISIVIDALHLPSEAIIPLFIAVDPIVTMFRVFVLVLGTCASTSIIIPRQSKLKKESDQSFPLGATQ